MIKFNINLTLKEVETFAYYNDQYEPCLDFNKTNERGNSLKKELLQKIKTKMSMLKVSYNHEQYSGKSVSIYWKCDHLKYHTLTCPRNQIKLDRTLTMEYKVKCLWCINKIENADEPGSNDNESACGSRGRANQEEDNFEDTLRDLKRIFGLAAELATDPGRQRQLEKIISDMGYQKNVEDPINTSLPATVVDTESDNSD